MAAHATPPPGRSFAPSSCRLLLRSFRGAAGAPPLTWGAIFNCSLVGMGAFRWCRFDDE